MKGISFKQLMEDYEEYYNELITPIRTEDEMNEIIFNLYNTDKYEIDWDKYIIELY